MSDRIIGADPVLQKNFIIKINDRKLKHEELGIQFALDDEGNAKRLLDLHPDTVYVPEEKKWFRLGSTWTPVEKPIEMALATRAAIFKEIKTPNLGEAAAEALWHWHKQCGYARRWKDMLDAAQSLNPKSVTTFDTDNDVINCQNGVVNLRTGKIADDYDVRKNPMMKQANVEFDAVAKSDLWEDFLKQIFPEGRELIDYVQLLLGYSITGHVKEQFYVFA